MERWAITHRHRTNCTLAGSGRHPLPSLQQLLQRFFNVLSWIAWPLSRRLSRLRRLASDVASVRRCSRFANDVGVARYRGRVGNSGRRQSAWARCVQRRTPLAAKTEPTKTARADNHGGERQRASKKREHVFGLDRRQRRRARDRQVR